MAGAGGNWVTIDGRHVFIKDKGGGVPSRRYIKSATEPIGGPRTPEQEAANRAVLAQLEQHDANVQLPGMPLSAPPVHQGMTGTGPHDFVKEAKDAGDVSLLNVIQPWGSASGKQAEPYPGYKGRPKGRRVTL